MYCSRCGAEVASDARFCANCGAPVVREPETPPDAPPRTFDPYDPYAGAPPSATADRPAFTADLPQSVTLSSAARRLGAHALDAVLIVVTLVLGWIVWSVIVWGRGQTPGKQLLGVRVLSRETLTSARRARMFTREVPCKWIIGFVAGVTIIGFVAYFWLLWDDERQELWDKMVDTIVVHDPENALAPGS